MQATMFFSPNVILQKERIMGLEEHINCSSAQLVAYPNTVVNKHSGI